MARRTNENEISNEIEELLSKDNDNTTQEEEMSCSYIVSQILNITQQIENLDDYFNNLSTMQSQIDEELSDLLHYIENNDLTPKQSAKIVKIIKEKRAIRRGLCNDYEIKKVYNAHKGKLTIDTQRQFFLNEIYKKAKELNSKYKNRQLSDDDIKELLK